jgi:hypothetical protein
VAEAGEKINVGGPWPDAVNGGERRMRGFGVNVAERRQRKIAADDGAGDFLERADFRPRQTDPRQPLLARADDRCRLERLERRRQPAPDRAGAGGGQLLRDHRGGKAGKAAGPSSKRRPPGFGDQRCETRVRGDQGVDAALEIGLGMDAMIRHQASPES